jgi:oligopeptide/dipeptide ABC transporter ATP-binding protein
MTAGALLSVEDLQVEFPREGRGVPVVDRISFRVAPGECVAIVGESGSGKSITCQAIMRILPEPGRISGGRITWGDENLLELPESRLRRLRGADIAMVFQDPSSTLNPVFTVGRQLTDVIRTHWRCDRARAQERAEEVLRQVGFPDPEARMRAYPGELSGGLRQRISIALALACGPKLVICDEATTNLDVSVQAQIIELLRRLKAELGFSIIFITHDIGLTPHIADRMLVMYAGHAVEDGPVREVLDNPAHPYTIGLLRSAPSLRSRRTDPLPAIPGVVPAPGQIVRGAPFATRCPVAIDGVCDVTEPEWQTAGEDHHVACHRFARDGRKGTAWVR